jgi:hypothetical protein
LENKPQISLSFFRNLFKGKTAEQIDDAITEDAKQNAVQPSQNTRSKILAKLEKLNEQARNRQPFSLDLLSFTLALYIRYTALVALLPRYGKGISGMRLIFALLAQKLNAFLKVSF